MLEPQKILEVGCNVGGNIEWLVSPERQVWGVDINREALRVIRDRYPGVEAIFSPARDLPMKDRYFDLVFTAGVLIHQPDETLPEVMAEMVRCSSRYVMCAEYFASESIEVSYRGVSGALFKRDYGSLFLDMFPLRLLTTGFLDRQTTGWDDLTWWIFERSD